MKGSRFIAVLQCLGTPQQKSFLNYIAANYGDRRNSTPHLLLKAVAPYFGTTLTASALETDRLLSRKAIAKAIKSKAVYQKTLHILYKELENFMVAQHAISDLNYRHRTLENWYRENHFKVATQRHAEKRKSAASGGLDEHWLNYLIEVDGLRFNPYRIDNFIKTDKALDQAYAYDKITHALAHASRNFNARKDELVPQRILDQVSLLRKQVPGSNPHIKHKVLLLDFLLDSNQTNQQLHEILAELELDMNKIERSEFAGFCTIINNYYSAMLQRNEWKFAKDYIYVLEFMERLGMLLDDKGEIMRSRFYNVVRILGNASDNPSISEWLHEFISRFGPHLNKVDKTFLPDFCRATVLMRLDGELDAAEDLLNGIIPNKPLDKIFYRREYIVLYFLRMEADISYRNLLRSYIKRYEQYVREQKGVPLTKGSRNVLHSFSAAYNRLLRCYQGPEEKLEKFVSWTLEQNSAETNWLRSRAEKRLHYLRSQSS